jgi:AcrR family transcriptional regulator
VSSAALYLYFPDKDAILRGIVESTFETLLAELDESQVQADSDLERLRAGFVHMLRSDWPVRTSTG